MPQSRRTRRKIQRRSRRSGPPPRVSFILIALLVLIAIAVGISRALP